MVASSDDEWMPILSRLNAAFLRTEAARNDFTPSDVKSSQWCGSKPASESEILEAESRLRLTLPPSYRSFLSISNGWFAFNAFIERLLPVKKIGRFIDLDAKEAALLLACYQEDDVSDEIYLDYETPEHMTALRTSYFPESILISEGGNGGELILLNPKILSADGEWEAIFFANWIPGNERYRSFRDLAKDCLKTYEYLQTGKSHRVNPEP